MAAQPVGIRAHHLEPDAITPTALLDAARSKKPPLALWLDAAEPAGAPENLHRPPDAPCTGSPARCPRCKPIGEPTPFDGFTSQQRRIRSRVSRRHYHPVPGTHIAPPCRRQSGRRRCSPAAVLWDRVRSGPSAAHRLPLPTNHRGLPTSPRTNRRMHPDAPVAALAGLDFACGDSIAPTFRARPHQPPSRIFLRGGGHTRRSDRGNLQNNPRSMLNPLSRNDQHDVKLSGCAPGSMWRRPHPGLGCAADSVRPSTIATWSARGR